MNIEERRFFYDAVLEKVLIIPRGKVTTYGILFLFHHLQIARYERTLLLSVRSSASFEACVKWTEIWSVRLRTMEIERFLE